MSDLPYIPFYPSDFFAAAMFLAPRQRPLYAYLLLMQADHGKIAMEPTQIAEHLDSHIGDVQAVLDAKFYYDNELGGWVNGRMRAERDKALQIIQNRRGGAAKARARKKPSPVPPKRKKKKEPEPEPEPEPASTLISKTDTKVDIKDHAERLYAAYPKKVGKPKAIKSILKSLASYDFDFLLDRTRSYAKSRQNEDPQYTCHPATWFNGERFNDDPVTWTNGNFKPKQPQGNYSALDHLSNRKGL